MTKYLLMSEDFLQVAGEFSKRHYMSLGSEPAEVENMMYGYNKFDRSVYSIKFKPCIFSSVQEAKEWACKHLTLGEMEEYNLKLVEYKATMSLEGKLEFKIED